MRTSAEGLLWIIGPLLALLALSAVFSTGWMSTLLILIPVILLLVVSATYPMKPLQKVYNLLLVVPIVAYIALLLSPGSAVGALGAMTFFLLMAYGLLSQFIQSIWERIALSGILGGTLISLLFLVSFITRSMDLIFPFLTLILIISTLVGIWEAFKGDRRKLGARTEIQLDYLVLALTLLLFFLFQFYTVYPNIFKLSTNDVIYHQAHARLLLRSSAKYGYWSYFGYHSLLAAVYQLVNPDVFSLMLSTVILNLFSLLLVAVSFSKLEHRKEALLIWGTFTSFAWLAVLRYGSDLKGLEQASKISYKSLTWNQPIMFWGLPLTLAIGLLAFLIYADTSIEGYRRTVYVALTTFFAFLVHVAEALVFASYLVVVALLYGRRRGSALGTVISGVLLTALYLTPGIYGGNGPRTSIYLLSLGILALILNEVRERVPVIRRGVKLLLGRLPKRHVITALLSIYIAGLAVWLIHMGEVDVDAIYFLGHVPWFFYPVLLGVTGLMAIPALRERFRPEYAILVLVSLAMGRFVTYYKLSGGAISYWEYRFPFYAALGLSVLAAPLFSKIMRASKRSLLASLLLGLVIFSGYSSTALSVEHWHLVTSNRMGTILDGDFDFAVNTHFFEEHDVPALSLSAYSLAVMALLSPPVNMRMLAPWISYGPEVTLYTLWNLSRTSRVAAVMTIGDVGFLERDNSSFNYLRWFMGPIRNYPSVTVLNLSAPPVLNSSLAVVLPSDTYLMRRALVAYELLRPSLPAHTIYLSDDPLAPEGLYIGPSAPEVLVDEDIPSSPYDLRWLYIWGNFSEGETLRVSGKRGEAISSFELDQGNYSLRACGRMLGYVALIYSFVNFDDYRILQIYLDRGFGIHRIVTGGRVLSGKPFRVPVRPTDDCVNVTLSLSEGNLTAYVNGRAYGLPSVERLGVLGLETGNFTGSLSGRIRGTHSVRWDPPRGSTLISVLGGPGDLDMREWVDRGLRNLTEVKRSFRPPDLGLNSAGIEWSMPPVKAVITGFNATGTVRVRGRPIWYSSDGRRVYLNMSTLEVRASSLRFRGGEGLYMDLDLAGALGLEGDGGTGKNVTIRFRLPVTVEAEGNITLARYHRFAPYISRTSEVRTTRAKFTVVMADNAQLLSELDVPSEDLSKKKLLYKSFDETRYLPEALTMFLASFAVLYYIDRRYRWEPPMARTPAKKRRKGKERKGKGKGGKS